MKRIKIKVHGHVQGVFFRYTTRKIARKLGLTGIVKNTSDGSVFIEAEGTEKQLNELLNFSKVGPKNASVDDVEFEFKDYQDKFKGFEYSF